MEITDTYLTIAEPSEGLFKDKGSKFISYAFAVKAEDDVKENIEILKKIHPSARHFCYAYRINPLDEYWRANDDGEPSSSAGKPILGQIRSNNLQEVLIVVVRYFGGTLLGVPGLINAYKSAAQEAISNAKIIESIITKPIHLQVNYAKMGDVMKFAKDLGFEYDSPKMTEDFSLTIHIPFSKWEGINNHCQENEWLQQEED
ncbi:MAG: YigZ family protein [Bacteroidia bacterium]